MEHEFRFWWRHGVINHLRWVEYWFQVVFLGEEDRAPITDEDLTARCVSPSGSRSRSLLHLTEETARHNGHLDILRELLDGTTGS